MLGVHAAGLSPAPTEFKQQRKPIRFGTNSIQPPTIVLAPAGSEGLDDGQIMIKKLYDATAKDILDRKPSEWDAMPLADKTALIRQYRDTVALGRVRQVPLTDTPKLHEIILDRLYQNFGPEVLDRPDDALAALPTAEQASLAGGIRDLAWLYRTLQVKMPTVKKDLSPTEAMAALGNDQEVTPEALQTALDRLKAQEQRNAVQQMLEQLYAAFKPAVFESKPDDLKDTTQRLQLVQCLRDLNITADLLKHTLEKPPSDVNRLDVQA